MGKEKNPIMEKPPVKKAEQKMQTIYTHGKTFVIPADVKLEDFLREKYPEEYAK